MNTLDSRSLKLGDCFAQIFETPGEIYYLLSANSVIPGAELRTKSGEGYLIIVNENAASSTSTQHTVHVSKSGSDLVPDTTTLTITAGDTVLWYTTDPTVTGFAVVGSGKNTTFSSGALNAGAIFTHAFGVPGTYDWIDPNHGVVAGTVVVNPLTATTEKDLNDWYAKIALPGTFQIRGGVVTPPKTEIMIGQTVFWKVWDGDGIAVVDSRLVPAATKRTQ